MEGLNSTSTSTNNNTAMCLRIFGWQIGKNPKKSALIFRCDSYELARRCNVVQQCEAFKQDHRPLKITLMYEALCPYCQRFIANNLGNLHSRFGNRTQLDLVPWGNALLLRNGQFSYFIEFYLL